MPAGAVRWLYAKIGLLVYLWMKQVQTMATVLGLSTLERGNYLKEIFTSCSATIMMKALV